jgi:tRNA (guanine-N7-)-methyltransferase
VVPSALGETSRSAAAEATASRYYGRRKGRRLRPGRQHLLAEFLPRLQLTVPEARGPLDPSTLFAPGINDVWMEIGFGAGEHLLAQALRHRDVGFIGCEPYLNGVAALLPAIAEANLSNIRVLPDDAHRLLAVLAPASLGRLFILFPDPWPKARHRNRRMVNPHTVRAFARVLRPGGELRLASDHLDHVRWMLEHVTRDASFRWLARRPGEWRMPPADATATRYERKARARGCSCVYLRFVRRRLDLPPGAAESACRDVH